MQSKVGYLIHFDPIVDDRGSLIALEASKNIPFEIKRVYYLFSTDTTSIRGLHSHKKLNQVMIAMHGSCVVTLDDGKTKTEYLLDSPNQGLFIGNNIWREMKEFSPESVITVIASDYYDESDYIRDYNEFMKLVETHGEKK